MREAPALAGATRPRPRSATPPKRKGAPRKSDRPATLLGRAFARPGVTIAGAVFAALMTGIVANAMFFQKGHHPAPLFKPDAPLATPPQPPTRAEIAPAVPATPAPPPPTAVAGPVVAPAAPAPAARSAPAPKPAASHVHKPAAAHAHADSIGDLIGALGHDGHKTAAPK